jgi:hypothetical protein
MVRVEVEVYAAGGSPVTCAAVSFHSNAWYAAGSTANGTLYVELLPVSYTFRAVVNGVTKQVTQNVGTNSTVSFTF